MDGDKERFFPIPFWGRGVRNEQNEENYSYRIRPELFDALSEIDLSDISPYYDEKSDAVMNTNIEKNLILYGPPGTGKTYHSAIYAVAIIENRSLEEVAAEDYRKRYKQYKDEGRIEFTTFHQSYGYEEFIEGIKPIMSDDGEVSYDVVPGVVKAFCEKAASPIAKENYVFIIDEINRGNISKILGELITLIEADKRLGEEESLRVKLPYSQKEFGVPDNVYIIGTMNTADRSIAAIDTALRRRFAFKEMLPDTSIFSGIEVDGLSIGKLLDTMNRRIEALYDREHTIGHAYFMPLKNSRTLDTLGEIFKNKILPLLQEYFYEDYKKIRLVLGDNQKPKEAQFIQEDPVNEVDLFGEDTEYIEDAHQYIINEDAFTLKAAYEKLQ